MMDFLYLYYQHQAVDCYNLNNQFLRMENRQRNSDFRLTNSFYGTKSGLITTVMQGGQEDDIRKSRIQHLPSYRKVDLSGKMQFVVVFQTMEIQRLSLEIESLRVMLKDADRQIRNYLNYEVQIKELTQNCHQLQQQQINYQNQVEQMSLACNSLYQQLSETKRQQEKDLQEIKKQFFRNKEALMKQNDSLKDKIGNLQSQLRQKGQSQRDAQNKMKAVSQELVRLNQNLYQTQSDLGQLRQKDSKGNEEINRIKQELRLAQNSLREEKNQSQNKKVRLQNQMRQRDSILGSLQQQKNKLMNELDRKKNQLQNFTKERQRDNKVIDNTKKELDQAIRQNESIKKQFFTLQNQYNNATNNANKLQKTNEDIKNQMKNIAQSLSKEKERCNNLTDFATSLKTRIDEKSKQVEAFKKYIYDLDNQCQAKASRDNQLIKKIQSFQPIIAQNSSLQEQLNQLNNKLSEKQDEIYKKERQINDINIEKQQLGYKIKQLDGNCQRNSIQLQRLEKLVQTQRQNNESQKKKLKGQYERIIEKESNQNKANLKAKQQLQRQVEKMKDEGLIKDELRNQVKRLGQNCKKQEKDIQTMLNRMSSIPNLIKSLKERNNQFSQIDKSNTLLRQQLEASLSLNTQLIDKVGSLYKEIDGLLDENVKINEKLREQQFKDDFSSLNSNSTKTLNSSQFGSKTPPAYSELKFSTSFPVKPFQTSIQRETYDRSSPSNNYSSIKSGYSTDRINFNADINVSRTSKSKSILTDGLESKKILEPSTYYPSRQSNYTSSMYPSIIGQYSSRDNGYGLQRRDRK